MKKAMIAQMIDPTRTTNFSLLIAGDQTEV
jgi:hypothetical protein